MLNGGNKHKNNMKIGIITTSSPIDKLQNEVIESGYKLLRENGFNIFEHPSCRKRTGYTAGSVLTRVEAIHDLVLNPSIDIIMAFWGGDNTNQILDSLDYELIRENPKIFIGYSDTSSLLNAIHKMTGIITYLGPAVITFCKPEVPVDSILNFKKFLDKNTKSVELSVPSLYAKDSYYKRDDNKRIFNKNEGWKVLREGEALDKKIVAINLTILQSLISTPYEPEFRDRILFCEIDESVNIQTLDRMFVQLRMTGIIDKLSGLVFSKNTDDSNIKDQDLISVLEENIRKDIPIVYNFDCGHTDPIITIPIGGECDLHALNVNINMVIKNYV